MADNEEMPPSFLPEGVKKPLENPPENPEDAADLAELEEEEEKRSRVRSLVETMGVIAAALLVSIIIKTFFLQAFWVPSGSMESTLKPDDRIAVNRMVDSAEEINRGDVVVFVDPGNWLPPHEEEGPAWKKTMSGFLQAIGILPEDAGQHLVKRVIGVGGDTVACCSVNGKITVNGKEITETYLNPGVEPSLTKFSVKVPENKLWVMGDNRSNSKDSRYHLEDATGGFVPVDNVVGRVWAVFYPFSRWGRLDDVSSVFEDVP